MARSLSSQKRLRQNKRRADRNKARKTVVKNAIKKVRDAIVAKDSGAAEKALQSATAILDRSGNRRTIHPKTAARYKSRLASQVNLLKAAK
ncbi:MAG: 30S ribosomal protein S20 [Phycisphaerae bacterium]|nr:30S ribosomal protein S20 [Phycisphaerae bacterium]